MCLKDFLKNKPFKILTDKNVGSIIMCNSFFLNLSKNHLDRNNSYININFNPLSLAFDNINSNLNLLLSNNHICKKLHKYLFLNNIEEVKLGTFKILPKINIKEIWY